MADEQLKMNAAGWGRRALQAYGLAPQRVEVLRHLGNLVLRVEAPETFCLRICPPGTDEDQLNAELEWLDALSRDTDLQVPEPVVTARGVLFRWIEGEPVSRAMSADVAAVAGQTLATLHRHVRGFRPQAHVRRRYDAEWLIGPQSWWTTAAANLLGVAHTELTPTVERCARLMRDLEEAPDHFGLIHADLHFGNLLRTKQGYAVIDFDSLGWGYYLFDMAYVEGELADYDEPSLIAAFRTAYHEASRSVVDEHALALFSAVAHVRFLEWVYSSSNPNVQAQKMRWMPVVLERMRKLSG